MTDVDRQAIRQARGAFAGMAGAYTLGVFNDNFFKQAACLLALAAGVSWLQGAATVLFTVPWLLLAAPAGWLSDRFSKRRVVILAKTLELLAMLAGALGILLLSWPLILVMVFTMGLQSAIFSPALNGSIPELYPEAYVIRANSILKTLVTVANLVGILLAGWALSFGAPLLGVTWGRVLVAGAVVLLAGAGLILSFATASRPAANPRARFPWEGPAGTLRQLLRMSRDRVLTIALVTDAVVWFIAVLQILLINELGLRVFCLGEARTSLLLMPQLFGVALGGAAAGRLASAGRWRRLLVPGFAALAVINVAVMAVALLPAGAQVAAVALLLGLAGVAGGILLVPLESVFQIRPPASEKGAAIASANFTAFAAILLAGAAQMSLNTVIPSPMMCFGVIALVAALTAVGSWIVRGVDCEPIS